MALGAVSGFDPVSEPDEEEIDPPRRRRTPTCPDWTPRRSPGSPCPTAPPTDPGDTSPTPTCRPTAGPWPSCSTPAWTAAWCRPSDCWWRRPTRCGSSSRATPGSWWATSKRSWPGCATGRPPSWSACSPASSACSRPCWPWPGCRPRTWSGTRPGCSSTPDAASSGPSPWSACCAPSWSASGPGWSRTSSSSRCSRRPRASSSSDDGPGPSCTWPGRSTCWSTTPPTPASVIYQLDRLFNHLADLPKQSPGQRLGDGEQLVLRDHHHAAPDRRRPTGRGRPRDPAGGPSWTPSSAGWTSCWPSCSTACGPPSSPTSACRCWPASSTTWDGARDVPDRPPDQLPLQRARCRGAGNEAHLRPRDTERQHCLASELVVEPTPTSWTERTDFFGNPVVAFAVDGPFDELTVSVHQLGVGLGS